MLSILLSLGPCFWVQHLAPPKYSRFLGYLTGWLTTALWWFLTAGANLFLCQLTLGAAQANNPGYQPPEWHYFLVYCAWATMNFLPNLPRLFKVLPYMLTAGVVIINASGLYLLVTLLVRATPKQSAHDVFVQVVNESGWPSNGVVFFLALTPGLLLVAGFDSVTHITDELETPTKQVPQVMIGSALLSAVTALIMAIVYSFCAVNVANLLNPYGHQPMIQLVFDSSRSRALATIASILMIVGGYLAAVATFTSWNRLYWSFAREGGLPFSRAMSKLSTRDALPVNAMLVNYVLTLGLGTIQLGSLTALNALAGSAVVCTTLTYSLLFGLLLWRGRNFLNADRWFNLGRFGNVAYVVAMVWCMFVTVWLCFPLYLPVTLPYMNWTSVVVVGISALSIGYWFLFRPQPPQA